jgi:pyruvate,water dikinase
MVTTEAREFPVDWRQPEDAEKLWLWDGMHCPRPLTPLSTDFATAVMLSQRPPLSTGREPPPPMFVNGYFYQAAPDLSAGPPPEAAAREEQAAAEAKDMSRLWQKRWLPQVRRVCREIEGRPYDAMSAQELRQALRRSVERAGRAFGLTLRAAGPMFSGVQKFYEFCEKEFGPEGLTLAGETIQGYHNASSAADAALWDLARLARDRRVDALLTSAPPAEAFAALANRAAGRELMAALGRYLDRFGWRTPTWWELSERPWREAPELALAEVARILSEGVADPRRKARTVSAKRRAALRQIHARLAHDPRAEFESLWRTARQFVPVSEGRALWQLSLSGYLRLPALALARALVAEGALGDESDIFYLTLDELEDDALRPRWPEVVAERRAARERWLRVVPPVTIGKMPAMAPATGEQAPAAPPQLPFGARMVSGFGGERSFDERILKGHAASPGVVQGRAKVVEKVEQADKVEQGDVLVCRFTTPSWAHLFSRVSAIVADSGGVLSHCAILAREYGIPCVPGVRVGTRRIRDGMLLTVDGSQGLVRLEE